MRAAVLAERELEYVAAARLRGERAPYILFAEILPNVLPPVIVEFTVRLGYAIFTVATLSFLGFGIQPPSPDWGLQIAEDYGVSAGGYWWPTLFPALAIASLVIGVNLIADGAAAGVRAMSATRAARRPRTRACATSRSPTACAAIDAPGAARRLVRGRGRASRTGWSASRAAASRPRRWPSSATCRATAA